MIRRSAGPGARIATPTPSSACTPTRRGDRRAWWGSRGSVRAPVPAQPTAELGAGGRAHLSSSEVLPTALPAVARRAVSGLARAVVGRALARYLASALRRGGLAETLYQRRAPGRVRAIAGPRAGQRVFTAAASVASVSIHHQ